MEAAEKGNKARPPPPSSSKRKKVVEIKGTAVSLKQRVEELHHAPGLVGSIVEKGFSSSDDYKSQQKPVTFPPPTVLPFPVARHRSHGPHWAPVSSLSDAAEEDDMEGEKDETDYDPIAFLANPVERKEKKGLDLSKWKELMPKNNADMPQSSKKGANVIARKAGEVNAGNREEAKKEFSPLTTSPPEELLRRSSKTGLTTRVEQKPSNQGSPSLMDETSPRAEKKPVPMDVEFETSVSGGRGSVSLMDDIDAENLARLKQMSADEISEAQAEIMEKMDPSLIEMLKKRAQDKLGSKKRADLKREGGWHDPGSAKPVGGGKSSMSAVPHGNWLPFGEHNNTSWKVWSERVEKVRGLRFSLEGHVMEIDSTQKQSNGKYNVENVTERDFLRTEGDPSAVGYTINEAVALIRSMVPGQRALALQLLASVLNKALQNLQSKDSGYNMDTDPVDKLVDWQAVWAFALGPEPQLALSLRIALDDNHDSVVLACAKVMQSTLSCEINENFFNIKEKSATHEKNICTAPVFRMRPELDGGFLHGGYWKYNTKPSNIIPYIGRNEDDESEGGHTIQDDIVVAGQDIAAGLIRMGILPRICYLMEMDPLPVLQECLVSILVALARHSPTCADAIIRCPRLVRTIIDMFTKQSMVEIHPSHIKAVILLKILSQSSKQICLDFVKCGIFQQAMWHWYKNAFTLEHWIKSGREHCKLTSALMVEQLRLWKVCIHYGLCITYFADFFPTMCLWLSPPTFHKLIENNVLGQFTSITREAYLVLEALARRLPILHSKEQLEKQAMDFSNDNVEYWSWSHVIPMVDLALNWLCLKNIPYVSSLIGGHKSRNHVQDAFASCMLWVLSATLHMLCSVFDRIAPENANDDMSGAYNHLPWLPHFVPKVGLEIIKNGFLDFLGSNNTGLETFPTEGGSLVEGLCYLRQQNNVDASLASVSCLQGLVRLALSVDRSVQRAKFTNCTQVPHGSNSGMADKILEEGIVKWAQKDLTRVLTDFMTLISLEWPVVQSVEMFGRGGPAPGIGFGWGSSGGGFWSMNVLLAQADARLILDLLKILPALLENIGDMKLLPDKPADALILQRISSLLGVCLVAGPGDRVAVEMALDILLQAPVLKYLNFCIHHYVHHNKGLKSFDWQYGEEDYLFFSGILSSHFRDRWLGIKKKAEKLDRNNHRPDISRKGDALETIHEEVEQAETTVKYPYLNSLFVEWAHQKLPLPGHWFLSAICSIGEINMRTPSSTDVLDAAKSGLFFLLGLEAASYFLCSDSRSSPISGATLVWKFHALSMALHASMDVLEDKSRDVFETLQELYGQHLDQLRHENIKTMLGQNEKIKATFPEAQENCNLKLLNFQMEVHESYSTFVENLIEQFAAISYGDVIYGRQAALYLHRTVEAAVRLAAWNVLSNAHVLELLPPLEKCIGETEGYLEPVEDHEGILEAYVKSWISGGLDRAAARGTASFTIALHHLSCFIFKTNGSDKLVLRNRLAKSLLRCYSQKQHHEGMLLSFIRHGLSSVQDPQYWTETAKRFELLKEACQGNSSLSAVVEKLKSAM